MEEHTPFNRAMVSWLGFSQIEPRLNGRTHYFLSVTFLFYFAVFRINSYCYIYYFGYLHVIFTFLHEQFYSRLGLTLMMTLLFFSGAILLGLGIIGEYVARIHTEVIKRPLFIAAETMNLKNKELLKHLSYFHSRFNKNLK